MPRQERHEGSLRTSTPRDHNAEAPSRVRIPLRRYRPQRVEVFLGPTNSGKTHQALAYLAERGSGIYAAPLRMLAFESYERLSARLGADLVGLVTGEEHVNEHAPVVCCTAEMAPIRAKLLVLDEVQWAQDPDRGFAWTRLLAGAEVEELYVTGEVGAAPFVKAVLGEDVPITYLERLCPLQIGHKTKIGAIPQRSVVVAFSRKAVLHLAGLLRDKGRNVSVLYGALPPEVRRSQIEKFVIGENDVVVATDVIGHGINLPVDQVVFAETSKFDGVMRRNLKAWETAQIGGRAGRYGLSDKGIVSWLVGATGFEPEEEVVRAVELPFKFVDNHAAYRLVKWGFVAPALEDLQVSKPTDLAQALEAWAILARKELAGVKWARVSSVEPFVRKLQILRKVKAGKKSVLGLLSLEDTWKLVRAPCDPDERADTAILSKLALALVGNSTSGTVTTGHAANPRSTRSADNFIALAEEKEATRHRAAHGRNAYRSAVPESTASFTAFVAHNPKGAVATRLEVWARELVILRWATLTFEGRLDVAHGDVSRQLDRVTNALNAALARAVEKGVAHCISCGKVCAPWFPRCDSCHAARPTPYYY
ncbi:MAG: helicase-related protein [Acidimicrobiales bacterium]